MQLDLHGKPAEGAVKQNTNFTSFPTRTPEEEKEVAKASGWKENKEELEAEGKKFVEADEFNRRGELIKTISGLKRALKKQESEISTLKQQDAHFRTMHQQEVQKAYEKAKADLKAHKLELIENGSHKEAASVEEQLDELDTAWGKEQEAAKQKASQGQLPPEVKEWMDDERNEWYHDDEDLAAAFEGILSKVIKNNKGIAVKDALAQAEERFAKKHPDVYATEEEQDEEEDEAPKKKVSKVAAPAGTSKSRGSKARKGWADLPEDVKQIAKGFIENGTFKGKTPAQARQVYADKYFGHFGKE